MSKIKVNLITIPVILLFICACSMIPNNSTIAQSSIQVNEQKENAVKKETGDLVVTAPVEVFDQSFPGIPIWPGVRLGGISKRTQVILPPVDVEADFNARLMKHRIEQRVYWTARINKGIYIGLLIVVVGVVIRAWAGLKIGSRVAAGGAAFSALCISCLWYFDYIPYISIGFVLAIVAYIVWELYDEKNYSKSQNELMVTVESLKSKLKSNNLGNLWEEVKSEVEHSKHTKDSVKKFKEKIEEVKNNVLTSK